MSKYKVLNCSGKTPTVFVPKLEVKIVEPKAAPKLLTAGAIYEDLHFEGEHERMQRSKELAAGGGKCCVCGGEVPEKRYLTLLYFGKPKSEIRCIECAKKEDFKVKGFHSADGDLKLASKVEPETHLADTDNSDLVFASLNEMD